MLINFKLLQTPLDTNYLILNRFSRIIQCLAEKAKIINSLLGHFYKRFKV